MTRCRCLRHLVPLLATLLAAGCASNDKPPPAAATTRPTTAAAAVDDAPVGGDLSNTDPCAARLHDLAGQLLLFYRFRGRLPDALDQLKDLDFAGLDTPPLICPKTNIPYVYNPSGIYLPETKTYVIVYDNGPYHAGFRWAITVREPGDDGVLVTKVVPLPERFFALRPPG